MENINLYQDISKRTNGDIYIGVVGPVRTGKSTFIKNFMDLLVIPNINDSYKQERAKDELPQSAGGRTIMTAEPKFIPNEAVEVSLENNLTFRARLVDCVGFLINNAIGYMEDDLPRMIKTPWFDEEIPFEEAARIGTTKVIQDHSTIGILVTTDGSITDIPREDYIEAEEDVVNELKSLNKPFIILLNSSSPQSEYTKELAQTLSNKYNSCVIPINCSELSLDDINNIFSKLLYEFPIEELCIHYANWIDGLDDNHSLRTNLNQYIKDNFLGISFLKDIPILLNTVQTNEIVKNISIMNIELGTGKANLQIELMDNLFFETLSEISNINISNEYDLFSMISEFSKIKKDYDKISYALDEANRKGYGIVTPSIDELILDEPEIVKQGSRFRCKTKSYGSFLTLN